MTCQVCLNKGGSWLTNGVCERCGRVAPNSGRPIKRNTRPNSTKSGKGNSGAPIIGLIILGVFLFMMFGGGNS